MQTRYTLEGPDRLGDAELIALILNRGRRPKIQVARQLLDEFGGLDGLAAAPPAALAKVPGLGPAGAVRVHAACALGRRKALSPPPQRINAPADAWRFLRPRLEGLPYEQLHGLYLGRRGRLLSYRALTAGNDSFTIVDPRQILRPAVAVGAQALVLAHNHPSGDPEPSAADLDCTRRVAMAADALGLALIDHLIIGRRRYTSLAELGALPPWSGGEVSTTGSY